MKTIVALLLALAGGDVLIAAQVKVLCDQLAEQGLLE